MVKLFSNKQKTARLQMSVHATLDVRNQFLYIQLKWKRSKNCTDVYKAKHSIQLILCDYRHLVCLKIISKTKYPILVL